MGVHVHLLGSPRLERDGDTTSPRGRKVWGLLAYLVRSEVPPSRERTALLLFPDADDPLGALRWSLSELRRVLGPGAKVGGDPIRLALHPGTVVDVDVLARGTWVEGIALPGVGRELLEGLAFSASPGFSLWLDAERRHLTAVTESVLHEAAQSCLARGQTRRAAEHASALVGINPLDENYQTLLVRCLLRAGDRKAALRQVDRCSELFRSELGVAPTPALRRAAEAEPSDLALGPTLGRAATLARLEAGQAAIAAGAFETGVRAVREAIAAARRGDHGDLIARALIALGSAMVHAARGTDEEGVTALHEGIPLAEAVGDHVLAATGWRELAWVEFLRARYARAERNLSRAEALAGEDDQELAWIDLIRGGCRSDVGDHAAGFSELRSAIRRADRADAGHPAALARALLGRLHLLRREYDAAAAVLDESLALAEALSWTSFLPWPESLRAEVALLAGDLTGAGDRFEHAFALACQIADPCWESIAARGMGLMAAARGDTAAALELLEDAPRRCRRLPDTYLWVEAYGLEALCRVAVEHGAPAASTWVDHLETITSRSGLNELLACAAVHRARLGEPGAIEVARSRASQVDNPALQDLVTRTP